MQFCGSPCEESAKNLKKCRRSVRLLVEIQAGAAEAFGQADFNPLGRPVTSALEALGVHIGFDQEDGVAVTFQPVGAEALQVKAQALGSQIGPAIFGREQREPSVAATRWRAAWR